jgi:hypothetical protein
MEAEWGTPRSAAVLRRLRRLCSPDSSLGFVRFPAARSPSGPIRPIRPIGPMLRIRAVGSGEWDVWDTWELGDAGDRRRGHQDPQGTAAGHAGVPSLRRSSSCLLANNLGGRHVGSAVAGQCGTGDGGALPASWIPLLCAVLPVTDPSWPTGSGVTLARPEQRYRGSAPVSRSRPARRTCWSWPWMGDVAPNLHRNPVERRLASGAAVASHRISIALHWSGAWLQV